MSASRETVDEAPFSESRLRHFTFLDQFGIFARLLNANCLADRDYRLFFSFLQTESLKNISIIRCLIFFQSDLLEY